MSEEEEYEYDSEGNEIIPEKKKNPKEEEENLEEENEDPALQGLTRKERKKLQAKQQFDVHLQELAAKADQVNSALGDSPFTVSMEQDTVHEGSRNISMSKVSVSVNSKPLFRDTSVKFSAGSRYGLMGPNGRGKSTLLRLLSNRELPVQKSLSVLLVEQEQEISGADLSCVEAVIKSHKLQKVYQDEAEILRGKETPTDTEHERLMFLEEELQLMGASQAESRARRILFGLGFPTDWHDRETKSFSGGWRKRIALASAVFIEPDCLLLDEPTNHLDLNAVIWLETYLSYQYNENQKRPKILIVVSHDGGFLDNVCSHMVHIESFKLNYYRGSFNTFQSQVKLHHQAIDKKHEKVQRLITEKKKNGWSNDKVNEYLHDQILQGKLEPEFLEKRKDYNVTFPFKNPLALRDGCICKLENVDFNYPNCPVLFRNVNCALWTDSRITLCGPNGIGKSTLLNLMTGILEPTSGHVSTNRQVRIGRYNQHFVDKLPLEKSCVDYLRSIGAKDEHDARRLLGSFGLEGPLHHNQIATLSGGQKARVAFASLSAEAPHFMLLDEPTNHLDMESIEALCSAINNFSGGILVVTHDARLIQETNMLLWVAGEKNVQPFKGGLDEYKEHVRQLFAESEEAKELQKVQKKEEKKEEKKFSAEVNPEAAKETAKTEKKVEQAGEVDDFFAKKDKKKKKK